MRPYDHHNGNRYNHDMNRQTQFDVGGGRDPPVEYGFRGYSGHPVRPYPLQPQLAQQPQPQPQQQQPQPLPHPQPQPHAHTQPLQAQPAGAGYDGRAGQFGYNPYGQYIYNPYGWNRPAYGWNRPQGGEAWRGTGSMLGFPFNLLGLGGGGGSSAYRPWWSPTRFPFGLF